VVLDQLHHKERARLWGVTAQSGDARFDFHKPLADRWIRFWPHPFGQSSKSAFHSSVETSAAGVHAASGAEREALRLLYVGWTRPRDRLVLALKGTKWDVCQLERFAVGGVAQVTPPAADGTCTWAGMKLRATTRVGTPEPPDGERARPDAAPVPAGEKDWPLLWLSPSKLDAKGKVGEPVSIGERRFPSGKVDMDQLGTALHAFFAADVEGLSAERRLALARQCLENRGVASALSPTDVVAAGDALKRWVATVAPGAKWLRELPVLHPQKDGSVVRGTADLVLESKGGLILVDHKSYPGKLEDALERAALFAGQLEAYARALEAALKVPVTARYIHLPLAGCCVEVRG